MKKIIPLLFLLPFLFTGCRSDDDGDIPLTGFERISDKNFILTDFHLSANGVTIANWGDVLDCERDDITRYENSGTAVTNDGSLKCDINTPQEEVYFWALLANDSKLVLDFGGIDVVVYIVLINDGNRLRIQRSYADDVDNDGDFEAVVRTLTYERL